MPSSSENQDFSPHWGTGRVPPNSQDAFASEQVDLSQVYTLIDSVLPFEACLYYQVLPLYIKGSRLFIGLVNLEDLTATEYVRKQLSYINYSITFKEIDSAWHRELLSKYLNYNAKASQQSQTVEPNNSSQKKSTYPWQNPPNADRDRNLQATYIVDQPDEIPDEEKNAVTGHADLLGDHSAADLPTFVPEASLTSNETAGDLSTSAAAPPRTSAPLSLQIDHRYRNADETKLISLPPHAFMQALLAKVLQEGIGRLYFERRPNSGRILWSKDGILQAVVDSVDSRVFQGVINELKLLTHLTLIAAQKPRQVEIERLYEGQRILLRLRVMPGSHGEEATLQVLRGTALRFYQQQQVDKLSQDALDAAQRLQNRLNEIQERARQTLNSRPPRSETLPAIVQLLRQIEAQVQEIITIYNLEE